MRSNITPSHSVRCYRASCAKRDVSPWGRVKSLGVELAMPIAVAVIGALGAALTVIRTTHRVGFSSHHRVDERGQQFAQHVGVGGGESLASTWGQSTSWAAVIALILLLE
jgi:hypothetical protein